MAILLTAAMAMGIAACGNQSESNKEAKKDDNTITVWCWDKTFNICNGRSCKNLSRSSSRCEN